ncbi:hypothetical protein K2173_008604 [Erythroxylum novogranatense]|uniref:Signal peptidase complex catalytic subunit SEC11 n=1 Tax=Erythroxylum novogranatense TaxID=1862640 RepID=A0AAV8SLJ0_9ROSI|nr:hypothetical protein K2173_008604 [Erythroxylum novogranatense]
MEYWTLEGLSHLASGIGRPICLDSQTAKMDRIGFAKICIEVPKDTIMPDSLKIRRLDNTGELSCVSISVTYPWKPSVAGKQWVNTGRRFQAEGHEARACGTSPGQGPVGLNSPGPSLQSGPVFGPHENPIKAGIDLPGDLSGGSSGSQAPSLCNVSVAANDTTVPEMDCLGSDSQEVPVEIANPSTPLPPIPGPSQPPMAVTDQTGGLSANVPGPRMIVTSALIIWKALMCITGTESPVVVVLSGSMEPGFKRGDNLFLHMSKEKDPIRTGEIVVFNVDRRIHRFNACEHTKTVDNHVSWFDYVITKLHIFLFISSISLIVN